MLKSVAIALLGLAGAVDTLMLSEHDGKTTMTCTVLCPSKEARERPLGTRMKDRWAKSYEHLDTYLRSLPR